MMEPLKKKMETHMMKGEILILKSRLGRLGERIERLEMVGLNARSFRKEVYEEVLNLTALMDAFKQRVQDLQDKLSQEGPEK